MVTSEEPCHGRREHVAEHCLPEPRDVLHESHPAATTGPEAGGELRSQGHYLKVESKSADSGTGLRMVSSTSHEAEC